MNMQHFPTVPLCPVCAGQAWHSSPLWPGVRYCDVHEIAMQTYDFTQWPALFSAVSRIRLASALCRLYGFRAIIPDQTGADKDLSLVDCMAGVIDVYDALRGADRPAMEYLKTKGRKKT